MTLLVLGLALWWASHLLPVFARPRRDAMVARLGEGPWKGLYSLVSLGAIALMVIGYQRADFIDVWHPPSWAMHVNNVMMLGAVFLFAASESKGNVKRHIRHPQLWSVIVWAAAHLLVNGDLASAVLFGGVGAWAIVAMIGINARDAEWVKPAPAPRAKDWLLVAITLVVYIVVIVIHTWLGVRPVPG